MDYCETTAQPRYPSPADAQKQADGIRHRNGGYDARIYRCVHCGAWHITGHSKKSRAIKNRKRDKARGRG